MHGTTLMPGCALAGNVRVFILSPPDRSSDDMADGVGGARTGVTRPEGSKSLEFQSASGIRSDEDGYGDMSSPFLRQYRQSVGCDCAYSRRRTAVYSTVKETCRTFQESGRAYNIHLHLSGYFRVSFCSESAPEAVHRSTDAWLGLLDSMSHVLRTAG